MAARITPSRGGKPDKLMRAALALELHRNVDGAPYGFEGKIKRLRLVANALVNNAINGDTASIREINDRMDGRVPQAIMGPEGGPIQLERIERVIVEGPANPNGEGVPPAG